MPIKSSAVVVINCQETFPPIHHLYFRCSFISFAFTLIKHAVNSSSVISIDNRLCYYIDCNFLKFPHLPTFYSSSSVVAVMQSGSKNCNNNSEGSIDEVRFLEKFMLISDRFWGGSSEYKADGIQ